MSPIVKEVIKLISAAVPSTIKVEQSLAPNCPAILADSAQIHHVVMNLCTNAYHAMRDTGGIIDVALSYVVYKKGQFPPVPNMPPEGMSESAFRTRARALTVTSGTGFSSHISPPKEWGKARVWAWPLPMLL